MRHKSMELRHKSFVRDKKFDDKWTRHFVFSMQCATPKEPKVVKKVLIYFFLFFIRILLAEIEFKLF